MKRTFLFLIMIALCVLLARIPDSGAYLEYADTGFGGCDNCHGSFVNTNPYVSLVDGAVWNTDLMDTHIIMVSEDCNICHVPGQNIPVFLNSSGGGSGLDPIGCVGCHGRAEDRGTEFDCVDPNNPRTPCGDGAGLRQHHYNASPDFAGPVCLGCHADTDPANYTPVDEDVKPPFYFLPDPNYPNKPTDPCNPNGEENYAGTSRGLDNDGDLIYDRNDCLFILPGDSNGDGIVDAGDISALVLEIFDGDGSHPGDVHLGTFPGDPVGSDANEDGIVDAGDISCTVLIIFNGQGACGGGAASASAASGKPVYGAAQAEWQKKDPTRIYKASQSGPALSIPSRVPAVPGGKVTVPVSFSGDGNLINSTAFSVDYDANYLGFDPADGNGDGIPDSITFHVTSLLFSPGVFFDQGDTDGELDFIVFSLSATLPDGLLLSITFNTGVVGSATETAVNFSQDPVASFGDTLGRDVPGTASHGSVLITPGGETDCFDKIDNDGDGLTDCTDTDCDCEEVNTDLDILRFEVSKKAKTGKPINKFRLTVKAPNGPGGDVKQAILVGVQDGKEVYRETRNVFDSGNGQGRFAFPSYTPMKKGTIEWTVEILDENPDKDEDTAITRVR